MNKFNWSEEELLAYEQMKKRIMDEVAALAQKFDEGQARCRDCSFMLAAIAALPDCVRIDTYDEFERLI